MPPGMAGGGGPKKTMMLQDSEGVVSFTGSGSGPVSRPGGYSHGGHSHAGHSQPGHSHAGYSHSGYNTAGISSADDGPTVLFWIVSLTGGIVVGVLAYLILLKLKGG